MVPAHDGRWRRRIGAGAVVAEKAGFMCSALRAWREAQNKNPGREARGFSFAREDCDYRIQSNL